MIHYSPAKKNRHQNEYKTPAQVYLYEEHTPYKKSLAHVSAETKAELNDDIYVMRRHFRHTVKKLGRRLYYTNWMKNIPESDGSNEQIRLHSRHAKAQLN
jgi:hypothetical protein